MLVGQALFASGFISCFFVMAVSLRLSKTWAVVKERIIIKVSGGPNDKRLCYSATHAFEERSNWN